MAQQYGKWRVVSSLGEGGQGHIFLVADTSGQVTERCVLKRLKNVGNSARRSRFEQEVQATQKIGHPNILRVYDSDLTSDKPYYVAEYCERRSLDATKGEPYRANIRATVAVLQPIVEALVAAHAKGIVHRDVKPANILFRKDGTPVIGDFGICHMEDGNPLTLSDEAVGSLNYIAPEMESGSRQLGPPTARTDVYSLGKVLYWMLSGGSIFARENHRANSLVDLLADQRFEHVHMLLHRMVVKEPEKRLHSNELVKRLEQVAALVEGGFAPLRPSIGIRCRFCGIGQYQRHAKEESHAIPSVGLNPAGSTVAVLRCSHCGHVELFVLGALESRAWWDD